MVVTEEMKKSAAYWELLRAAFAAFKPDRVTTERNVQVFRESPTGLRLFGGDVKDISIDERMVKIIMHHGIMFLHPDELFSISEDYSLFVFVIPR